MKLTDVSTIAGGVAALLTILGFICAFYKWSFNKGQKNTDENSSNKRKHEIFENIYAPLRVELTNTRFVTYKLIKYPHFQQRLEHAFSEFKERKYYRAKFRAFFKAISDEGNSETMECDTIFPSKKIKSIIEKTPQYTDKGLVDKVHQLEVMVATPWDHDEEEIIKEQYHLANYIYDRYDSLQEELHNK